MTFAALSLPLLAGLAIALAGAVVALHMLERTPRAQVVSNIAFWVRAAQRSSPKSLLARSIPWLSALLALALAWLLLAEVGDPRFGQSVGGTTVLVVAAGRTMQAGDGRQARASAVVREWAERGTNGGRVAIVRAGVAPRVLVPVTERAADAEITLPRADDGAADLPSALDVAQSIVRAAGGEGRIVVITDTPTSHTTEVPQLVVPVGERGETIGVSSLIARRHPTSAGEYVVQGEVTSFASHRARARLVVRDRDVAILRKNVSIEPGQRESFRASGFSRERAEIVAMLEEVRIEGSRDVLAADDRGFVVANPMRRLRIGVSGNVDRFTRAAIEATGVGQIIDAVEGTDVVIAGPGAAANVSSHQAVLALGNLDAVGFNGADSPPLRTTSTVTAHPAFEGIAWNSVRVSSVRAIVPAPGDVILVRAGASPVVVAREVGGRRLIATGFEIPTSDLPTRAAFPLVIHGMLRWLGRANVGDVTRSRVPGEVLVTAPGVVVVPPNGRALDTRHGQLADTSTAGFYRVGREALAFSTPASPLILPAAAGAPATITTFIPPLSWIIAIALAILLLAEWALLNRGRLD